MKDILKTVIESAFLSQSPGRPYYSEAAVQLKLGMELWRRLETEPVMEIRHPATREKLDIFLEHGGVRYGIELKYKTKPVPGFGFTAQGAHDHGRYDFINDIGRIESFIASGFIQCGFACLVTNDPLYWGTLRETSFAKAFQLTDGTVLNGIYTPKWKNRTRPITLHRTYSVEWLSPTQTVCVVVLSQPEH
jgi:hypothetical protein